MTRVAVPVAQIERADRHWSSVTQLLNYNIMTIPKQWQNFFIFHFLFFWAFRLKCTCMNTEWKTSTVALTYEETLQLVSLNSRSRHLVIKIFYRFKEKVTKFQKNWQWRYLKVVSWKCLMCGHLADSRRLWNSEMVDWWGHVHTGEMKGDNLEDNWMIWTVQVTGHNCPTLFS